MEKESCRLLFFVKEPVAGKVKTRLAAAVGESAAVELYKCFILDMMSVFEVLNVKVDMFVEPEDGCRWFAKWFDGGYSYFGQSGSDLGERMKNAFSVAFDSGAEKVVLVGSDVPGLSAGFITEALAALDTCDAVIGPAYDGGYYLMGFRQVGFLGEVFDGIEWSSDKVFARSIEILKGQRRKIHVLGKLEDIDSLADLKRFFSGYAGVEEDSAVISYIMGKKLLRRDDIPIGDNVNE